MYYASSDELPYARRLVKHLDIRSQSEYSQTMIRILFLAANPVDQVALRQGPEFTAIYNALDQARFVLILAFAATPTQLQDLLFAHKPQIVHFSGHGTAAGLYFEDTNGLSTLVAPETLHDLFTHVANTVRCVVLNACYSKPHAAAIGAVIDTVVGTGDAVTDDAAVAFAEAFYRGLANDKSLAAAVDLGRNQIDLIKSAEADKPQFLAERIDPTQVQARDWDVPDADQQARTAQTINTGGGSHIGGDINAGGNVAGRDYIDKRQFHIYGENAPTTHGSPVSERPTTPCGIFGLYPFNEHFFGRDEELAALHRLLQSEPKVSICPTITGMGGLGKTQLAAHYARAHVTDYPDGIFWITAANLNDVRRQLADFCVALNLPVADPQRTGDLTEQKISAFKAYLDQHPRALLILDNVEEPEHLRTRQIGVGFTTLTLGGRELVTTRRRKLPGDRFAELPLERLLPAPARQILTTARTDLATDPDLDRLCEQFGYLPLMLNLAAAALAKRGGSISSYLQKLQEWGIDTLHDRARVNLDDYQESLAAVLQEQWAMLASEDARLLLRVAGQLDEAEVIPTARLGLLAGLRDVDEWECPLRDGLEELERASLVEVVNEESVRLHPFIRDFAKNLITSNQLWVFRNTCIQHVYNAYCQQDGLLRLGKEYEQRGIAAIITDLIAVKNLMLVSNYISNSPVYAQLQALLQLLRHEAHKLTDKRCNLNRVKLWQQVLFYATTVSNHRLMNRAKHFLSDYTHCGIRWVCNVKSPAFEQILIQHGICQ